MEVIKTAQDKLIAKILDKSDKLIDLALIGGIGFAGYRIQKNPMDAIFAMLGYKLATNTGGASGILPNVSRVAGLGILATVGLSQPQPEIPTGHIQTSISSCNNMGGTVIEILPDGFSCICDLPTVPPPPAPFDPTDCPPGYEWHPQEQRCIKSNVWL